MRRGLEGVSRFRGARFVGGTLIAAVLCVVSSSSAAAAGLAAEDHVFPAPAVDATSTDAAIVATAGATSSLPKILRFTIVS